MLPRGPGPAPDRPVLALRAEGGPVRGAGHLGRCLALAQAWVARAGEAVLVAAEVPEPWAARYAASGVAVVAPGVPVPAHWWVVDGYDLDLPDQPVGALLGRIDDHGLSPGGAVDVLIDQNLDVSAASYEGRARHLLLGTRYAMLRREIVAASPAARAGADRGDRLCLLVAAGGAPSGEVRAFFDEAVGALRHDQLEVTSLAGTDDPVPGLAGARLALAGCGSTVWELCLFGVPSVLVALAANQEPLGRALQDRGAARYLGPIGTTTPAGAVAAVRALAGSETVRAELSTAARAVVDGRGAARVATRLRAALVSLRPAERGDAERVLAWNNDPRARAASFHPEPIAWADHVTWFEERLADPDTPIYVAADHRGVELGVVRFALRGPVAEISIALAAHRRGQGWGPAVIDAGCRELSTARPVARIDAQVKASNRASVRSFLDADFDAAPGRGPEVLRYARTPWPR